MSSAISTATPSNQYTTYHTCLHVSFLYYLFLLLFETNPIDNELHASVLIIYVFYELMYIIELMTFSVPSFIISNFFINFYIHVVCICALILINPNPCVTINNTPCRIDPVLKEIILFMFLLMLALSETLYYMKSPANQPQHQQQQQTYTDATFAA